MADLIEALDEEPAGNHAERVDAPGDDQQDDEGGDHRGRLDHIGENADVVRPESAAQKAIFWWTLSTSPSSRWLRRRLRLVLFWGRSSSGSAPFQVR